MTDMPGQSTNLHGIERLQCEDLAAFRVILASADAKDAETLSCNLPGFRWEHEPDAALIRFLTVDTEVRNVLMSFGTEIPLPVKVKPDAIVALGMRSTASAQRLTKGLKQPELATDLLLHSAEVIAGRKPLVFQGRELATLSL